MADEYVLYVHRRVRAFIGAVVVVFVAVGVAHGADGAVSGAASIQPLPTPSAAGRYMPLTAARLLDTRSGTAVAAGASIDALPGSNGIPADATALVVNVTATATRGAGYVTVYPTGATRPEVSNLNIARAGQTIANLVTVPTGLGGAIRLYTSAGTHLIVDLVGAYAPANGPSRDGRLELIDPSRIIDTRDTSSPLNAGETRAVQVLGHGGLPATGASAVILNITATATTAAGWVTVYPCNRTRPNTSTLNPERSAQTIANQTILQPDATGRVCIYTTAALHVIVDATGWYTDSTRPLSSAGQFVALAPRRLLDTRSSARPTPGGRVDAVAPVEAVDASALALNVTITDATQAGYLTAFDADTALPAVSTVNASAPGETVANHAVVGAGSGAVRLFVQPGGHVLVDAFGWFTGDHVVAAVGDMACEPGFTVTPTSCQHRAVSDAIVADPTIEHLLALGDLQYQVGALSAFMSSYEPTYGRLKDRTIPTPGNHEYGTTGAVGYFTYFGPAAAQSNNGLRSVDIGSSWHVIVLNSNCTIVSCSSTSAQATWLAADLAANRRPCTVAIWHHPRFSSGTHGNDPSTSPLWDTLRNNDADLVLTGHDHAYERFAPMRSDGTADPARGIREFVAGTGGAELYPKVSTAVGSEYFTSTHGYLRLTLAPRGYTWAFVRLDGSVADEGSGKCH